MTSRPVDVSSEDERDHIVVDLNRTEQSLRSIDESPPLDRPRLRGEELVRLQTLEAAVRAEGALSPFGFDRRLALVRRLRARLGGAATRRSSSTSRDMSARNVPTVDEHDEHAPERTCGRCREVFEGDPTLPAKGRTTFWLCPRCRAILLPGR